MVLASAGWLSRRENSVSCDLNRRRFVDQNSDLHGVVYYLKQSMVAWYIYLHLYHENKPFMRVNIPLPRKIWKIGSLVDLQKKLPIVLVEKLHRECQVMMIFPWNLKHQFLYFRWCFLIGKSCFSAFPSIPKLVGTQSFRSPICSAKCHF